MDKSINKAEVSLNELDHRKIGEELELFSFHEEGPGFPFFLPKGLVIKNQLIELWRREHKLQNYNEIESPIMLDRKLWEQSGHWQLFREHMYVAEVDKRVFAIKPMNCPGAILYYQEKRRSFSELPFRICELGQVHRNENSGSLHGLFRVRSFIVDDAHIFCSHEQLASEIKGVIGLCLKILRKCGFNDFNFELSVRSDKKKEKYLGNDDEWALAENVLAQAANECGFAFKRMEGEAKFYGPALDLKINDSAGRQWQCSSIQMDFNLGKRFNIVYYDQNGQKHHPFIIHRALFGSLERFMGVLLEHYRGDLPMWLAPVQVKLLSVSPGVNDYAESIENWFVDNNVRYESDLRDDNISGKIKKAQIERVPIMIIIGKKEKEQGKISMRLKNGEQRNLVALDELKSFLS